MTQVAHRGDARHRDIPVRLRGLAGRVDVDLDSLEHDRRRAAGTAGRPLGSMAVLDALLSLPEQVTVPVDRLDPGMLSLAAQGPAAVTYPSPATVRRVGRPAASARLFSLPTSDWRHGIRQLHKLAPYCARRLILTAPPRSLDLLLLEASYWGIGVALEGPVGESELQPTGAFTPARYTGAAWYFDEALYSQVWQALEVDGSWLDRAVA